jgi:MFS family permease
LTAPAASTARAGQSAAGDRYKWVALSNPTLAVFVSALDGSIVLIALPPIFRGIHLDPLAPGNISYLVWMIMGHRLVQAVLVVTLGRLGDMFGRVRIYNAGFVVFTIASILTDAFPADQRGLALGINQRPVFPAGWSSRACRTRSRTRSPVCRSFPT